MNGRLFQGMATKARRWDAGDGLRVCGGMGEEQCGHGHRYVPHSIAKN